MYGPSYLKERPRSVIGLNTLFKWPWALTDFIML